MRVNTIKPLYVESFPKVLEDGVLYISPTFKTACHLCCCGCGTKIVTPLRPTEYRLVDVGGQVSLFPSIGNWNHPCQSHYVIRNGLVMLAGAMERDIIEKGRAFDEAEKRAYFERPTESWWRAAQRWLKDILG